MATKATNGTKEESIKNAEIVDVEPSFYEDIDNLKKLCDFLRSSEGPPVREAVEMDKRVYYIKGEKLVNFLVEPKKGTKWPSALPKFDSRTEAINVCKDLCKFQFVHRSEKRAKGELIISRIRDFDEGAYFTWIYEGDKKYKNLMTTAIIIGFLFCTCFPIWPNFLKVSVWYLSVSFLLFFFTISIVRWLVFLFVWIIGYEFWILPNIYDESLGFYDSFKPWMSFEPCAAGQLPYRIGVFVAFFSFCYWAVTQPSEFDGFVQGNQDFLKDLYAGTLLSDMSQADKESIDKPKMQSLEDLLTKLDEDEEDKIVDTEEDLDDPDALDSMLDNLVDEEEDIDEDEE